MSVKALPALAKKLPHSRSPRLISVACIGGGGIGGGGIGGRGGGKGCGIPAFRPWMEW